MEFAVALIVLSCLVAFVVIAPLRRPAEQDALLHDRVAELEAAKESKYREIRDTELDYRMGKLSEADWRATDRELRAQAIEILRELDQVGENGAG